MEVRKMSIAAMKEEIRNELKAMGYKKCKFIVKPYDRWAVEVFKANGEQFGIYDFAKHSFVA